MRTTVVAAAIATLSLLALSCSEAKPCTTCPDVQGTYVVVLESKGAELSTCKNLYVQGGEWEVDLFQTGSKLEAPLLWDMKGTLFEDNGASFGPKQVAVANTDPVVMANVTIGGTFTDDAASRSFSGSVSASAIIEDVSCVVNSTLKMTKKAAP
jgi:hypothetical protein